MHSFNRKPKKLSADCKMWFSVTLSFGQTLLPLKEMWFFPVSSLSAGFNPLLAAPGYQVDFCFHGPKRNSGKVVLVIYWFSWPEQGLLMALCRMLANKRGAAHAARINIWLESFCLLRCEAATFQKHSNHINAQFRGDSCSLLTSLASQGFLFAGASRLTFGDLWRPSFLGCCFDRTWPWAAFWECFRINKTTKMGNSVVWVVLNSSCLGDDK